MGLDEQRQGRIEKIDQLRAADVNPYPYRFERSAYDARYVIDNHEALVEQEQHLKLAGRLMSIRDHGKTKFAHILDAGGQIQIYVRKDTVGADAFDVFNLLDVGDWIGVEGPVFVTRMGEVTINVQGFTVLSKSVRPLPEKWHGLRNVEIRYRQRYVDLVMNPEVREVFKKRTQIIQIFREVFNAIGGVEVETPTLQPLYGGASARPFTTYHNALGCDFYLRIADELYLKRLIVGGFDCVYEIAKDFRNEGMSRFHNPEFTMAEIYWAFHDYTDMMDLTERLMKTIADRLYGTRIIEYQGHTLDMESDFQRRPMVDLVKEYAGIDAADMDQEALCRAGQAWLHAEIEALAASPEAEDTETKKTIHTYEVLTRAFPTWTWGEIVGELFERTAEPHMVQPCFVIDFPKDISPLAKIHRDDPRLTERFELFIAGKEIANAFSELNDPVDQRARFEAESHKTARGDQEAQQLDDDFLRALEYGMPPTGGLGIGVDRVTMLFTDQSSIQDVILFPHMRPERYE